MNKVNRKYINLLSAGHLFSDVNQGALPAMLPFFIAEYGFNYAKAAGLVFGASLISSIIQPLIGHLADKKSRPWMMAVGVLLAGGGMAATGFFSNYIVLFMLVMISGVGVAIYHPEAASMVNMVSHEKKGTGISIFSFGGSLGFALGPIIVAPAILLFGIKGVAVLVIPAIIMAIWIGARSKKLAMFCCKIKESQVSKDENKLKDRWGAFSILTVVVFITSIIFYALNTFLALYWIGELNQSDSAGSIALSIMFGVGALATLVGGAMSDKFGFIKIVRIGTVLFVPFMFLFLLQKGVVLAFIFLIPMSFFLFLSRSPLVVLGQSYLPNRVGLASGVTLGLSVSIGGLGAPLLGKLADSTSLMVAMQAVLIMSVIPLIFSFILPKLKKR